jgi:hypothetical protein
MAEEHIHKALFSCGGLKLGRFCPYLAYDAVQLHPWNK